MLLILEITLTIAAWKNGWGPRALLPLICGLAVAFFLGVAVGASGGTLGDVRVLGFFCDLGAVIVLGVMACRCPGHKASRDSLAQAEDTGELQSQTNI